MPKQKTHKGMKKRFKVTASGKLKHRSANRHHRMGKKTGKRKLQLRGGQVIEGTEAKNVVQLLLPGM
ncbi:50S ribosomal protein L35 [Calycomorphotria hydatis]|uniref:Large ribosomal subunit protein bL35 n=1 Tax=Calycomorphotria hydatis TaxID=2528027 RepID=A0A517TD08_9PLAN|nr:50S ribosomal protein L35 [Calycomorphotria hydatis]QDT66257.1 50S ribosomal protein L35 [Calycomorphotria hydatis]